MTEGDVLEFAIETNGGRSIRYQWNRNGIAIPDQTAASMRFAPRLADNSASYTVTLSFDGGSVTSDVVGVRVESPRLINISTRAFVGTGAQAMAVGFVIRGQDRRVLIRAVGPSLTALGVEGVLPNPQVQLINTGRIIASNDDWEATIGGGEDAAASARRVGAFPLQSGGRDAVIQAALAPGNYTVEVQASEGPLTATLPKTGIALVEVYELP